MCLCKFNTEKFNKTNKTIECNLIVYNNIMAKSDQISILIARSIVQRFQTVKDEKVIIGSDTEF